MPPIRVLYPATQGAPRGPAGAMKSVVALSPAQIMALHTTPRQLVPAVPGKTIVPYFVWFQLDGVTVAYSADEVANFGWTAVPSSFIWTNPTLSLNANTSPFGVQLLHNGAIVGSVLSSIQGAPFYVDLAADVTTGDGTAHVTTLYEAL